MYHAVTPPVSSRFSLEHDEVVYGLDLVRNILAVPVLSDQTRSFLALFLTKIYDDWDRTDFAEVKKLESQLKMCLRSPDVLESLRGASYTLSQTFHIDLPDYVHLIDGVEYYELFPTRVGSLSPTIITPTIQLRRPCTNQLHDTSNLQSRSSPSRLRIMLKLLHGSGTGTATVFSSKDLPGGFDLRINKFLAKPENGLLIKDITSQLEIYHGLEVEIKATKAYRGKISRFAVAIERWTVWSRQEILDNCKTIPKKEVLSSIATCLAKNRSLAADIIELQSVIKIDLFEPFSQSRIFDIPVRGVDCLHNDAFDLKVFLETRSKPLDRDHPPLNDWRCPICSSECTPEKLVKDEFLVEVREHLQATNQSGTRSIIVDHRGNWQRVVEHAVNAVLLDAGL